MVLWVNSRVNTHPQLKISVSIRIKLVLKRTHFYQKVLTLIDFLPNDELGMSK